MRIELVERIADLPAGEWDALSGRTDGGTGAALSGARPLDPFTTHRFLAALEASGSVGKGTGWLPHHLVAKDEAGRLLAAMPLYAKGHSQGEYIFDHAFAEAYERAGGSYYPKLQSAVPFTPATGRRILGDTALAPAMLEALRRVTQGNDLSSAHVTFCTAEEAEAGGRAGFLHRISQQYHWYDRGYGDFEGFLAALSSRKRKMLRKERAAAQGFGGEIVALTGDQIEPRHWQAFWAFYQDTGSRKWGRPYLTRGFFEALHETMRKDVLLVLAVKDGAPIAGALNFIGAETLYGRYWGCREDHPFLHFELCYYQAIDWALAHGLSRVEAGAQGEHKLARGYEPAETHSLHWFPDPGFQRAVAEYLTREGQAVAEEMEHLGGYTPFRKGPEGGGGDG